MALWEHLHRNVRQGVFWCDCEALRSDLDSLRRGEGENGLLESPVFTKVCARSSASAFSKTTVFSGCPTSKGQQPKTDKRFAHGLGFFSKCLDKFRKTPLEAKAIKKTNKNQQLRRKMTTYM